MLAGMPVHASTKRQTGATGNATTQIASLTLRQTGLTLLQPVSARLAFEQFGTQVSAAYKVYADWPADVTDDLPVQAGDELLLASGKTYPIFGVEARAGSYLTIYLQVPSE